jgi:WhiB family transcriptional regulator, redox-sensing transcriptional regulator
VDELTRARTPRPHEVEEARRDERLLRAFRESGRDPAWRTRGACQTVDPETFFPAPSEPADTAIALCRSCPVQGACLAWALQAGDLHGVWGGTTARERRAMAVVWQNGRRQPIAEEPSLAGAGRGPLSRRSAPPPAELATMGAVMDRAELLRLVKAG